MSPWPSSRSQVRSTHRSRGRPRRSPPALDPGGQSPGLHDCAHCRICETNCPPHALFPEKQLARGQRRWYVSFDKCAPYFAETRGCGICIEVCPWSTPGKGQELMPTLLERRQGAGGAART